MSRTTPIPSRAPTARAAPALQVSHWFNTKEPLTLESLRGRVVVLHAFQMLCPGCVSHGLPQAQRIADAFAPAQVAVVGLHTVFEHHAVMGSPAALQAFIHEYRLRFPVGIDMPGPTGHGVPRTMAQLDLRGTPSVVVLDRHGRIRLHHFGTIDDLRLGALLGQLVAEPTAAQPAAGDAAASDLPHAGRAESCDADGCSLAASGKRSLPVC